MKHYEIQEFEAKVRSILSHWGMKDEAIDVAIEHDVYLNLMEEEMEMGAATRPEAKGTQEPKVFESLVKSLTTSTELASTLRTRTASLVSALIESPPIIDKDAKESIEKVVSSTILVNVLREISVNLNKSLAEISNNLDKLDNAW